jgi:hypothetical protein
MATHCSRKSVPAQSLLLALLALAGGPLCSSAAAQSVTAGTASGARAAQVSVSVTLQNGGLNYFAAVESRVAFDPVNIPIAAKVDGTPDCTVNPSIQKQGSFAFWPSGCIGKECQQLRTAITFTSSDQSGLIPNGSTLYTCKVNIASTAPTGTYPLVVTGTGGSTAGGVAITTSGVDGYVNVF